MRVPVVQVRWLVRMVRGGRREEEEEEGGKPLGMGGSFDWGLFRR